MIGGNLAKNQREKNPIYIQRYGIKLFIVSLSKVFFLVACARKWISKLMLLLLLLSNHQITQ